MHWIDPEYLPMVRGIVQSVILDANGDLDGVLLHNGLEVHVSAHILCQARVRVSGPGSLPVCPLRAAPCIWRAESELPTPRTVVILWLCGELQVTRSRRLMRGWSPGAA